MHRGWMDNPALGGAREPYCRRAAWAWLIENACWQDTKIDAGGKTIAIKRGQLCYSVRYLAEAWSWTPSAVQRFIERLKTDTMIDTVSDTRRLVITICNYEVYQAPKTKTDTPTDTVADTLPIQTRYSSDTNKKEGNKGKKEGKEEEGAPIGAALILHDPETAKKSSSRADAGTRLSKDWYLPMAWGQWALDRGVDHQTIRNEADQFRDHWISAPGSKGRKADWEATWRNWIRRNMKDAKHVKQSSSSKSEDLFDGLVNAAFDIMDAGAGAHNVVPLRTAASAW
jgi:hypothetical protein